MKLEKASQQVKQHEALKLHKQKIMTPSAKIAKCKGEDSGVAEDEQFEITCCFSKSMPMACKLLPLCL